jgi:hypothetical protein
MLWISGNKKPINLEPKMAGLMGFTKWGHQRKAVAIVMTDTLKKSSAYLQKNFIKG